MERRCLSGVGLWLALMTLAGVYSYNEPSMDNGNGQSAPDCWIYYFALFALVPSSHSSHHVPWSYVAASGPHSARFGCLVLPFQSEFCIQPCRLIMHALNASSGRSDA